MPNDDKRGGFGERLRAGLRRERAENVEARASDSPDVAATEAGEPAFDSDGIIPTKRPLSRQPLAALAGCFMLFAGLYAVAFNIVVRTNPVAALSRFDILQADERYGSAAPYAARAAALYAKAGAPESVTDPLRARYAQTLIAAGKPARGAAVYRGLLSSDWYNALGPLDQAVIRDHLARSDLIAGNIDSAARIYLSFIETFGAASDGDHAATLSDDALPAFLEGATLNAATLFSEALKPVGNAIESEPTRRASLLAHADERAELGAFYATREDALYAAAGLLSSAYDMRVALLGADHPEAIRAALILGPVYEQLNRLSDAEALYLKAFHAQEKVKGSNNPDLSLYIKLLVGVYERQGRVTEAAALNEHMRTIFRDAFGAQRYAANRERDRRLDIDRPVSKQVLLPSEYAPGDLVPAYDYSLPLSKNPGLDEMKIRLAADGGEDMDPREANMPVRLAQLISLCTSETGEALSLRSGYRSFGTQRDLFSRLGQKGTVTPAGMSEHQLGLAADIDVGGRLMRQSDLSYQCFEENAFRFGFILSYPPGNDYLPTVNSFEPWHWRYVGVKTAQLYREIGPLGRPQEFLNRLPCYVEKAVAGGVGPLGEADLCLGETGGEALAASGESPATGPDSEPENASPLMNAVNRVSARKLNNTAQTGRKESR